MVIGLPHKGSEWEPILQEFRKRMKRAGILGIYTLWFTCLMLIIMVAWSHVMTTKEGKIIQWDLHKSASHKPVFSVAE